MSEFEGKGAVITGGANGIGLATATELARRGVRLVLADVDKPALEQAVTYLQGQGFEAHGVMCDVRYLEEMTHLADEAFRDLLKKHGRPVDLRDALRRSAGVSATRVRR